VCVPSDFSARPFHVFDVALFAVHHPVASDRENVFCGRNESSAWTHRTWPVDPITCSTAFPYGIRARPARVRSFPHVRRDVSKTAVSVVPVHPVAATLRQSLPGGVSRGGARGLITIVRPVGITK
jgi:hypothetical protein